MPSLIQCQSCFLAINVGAATAFVGIANMIQVLQFAYCSTCGVTHIIKLRPEDKSLVIDDVLFDTGGPRTIKPDLRSQTREDAYDLTLCSPVAENIAFAQCNNQLLGMRFDAIDHVFTALCCGDCFANRLRLDAENDSECPRCHLPALRNVGGWI